MPRGVTADIYRHRHSGYMCGECFDVDAESCSAAAKSGRSEAHFVYIVKQLIFKLSHVWYLIMASRLPGSSEESLPTADLLEKILACRNGDGGFSWFEGMPSNAIITAYPDFNERSIGFKRFSDVMKQLEKDGLVIVEMDEQKTMLIKLL